MDLLKLLGASDVDADYAWVLRHALSYLERIDVMRLIVVVLERGGRDARRHVHWLRCGDAPIPPIDENKLLEEAGAHACWRALIILLEDLRVRSPSWVALHDEQVPATTTDAVWARATVAHGGTHFRFGVRVANAAASRGDLAAVQWLLPRSAPTSGHVEPTRRETTDERRGRRTVVTEILRAAANARHLHVVDWIVQVSPPCECVLPYDEELQAVAWIVRSPQLTVYSCATAAHGFGRIAVRSCPADESYTTHMTVLSLADGFARDGDLATLEKIYARPNSRQLIGSHAIAEAAKHGHLYVVQWIYDRFPHALSVAWTADAVRRGHIVILEWLQQLGIALDAMRHTIISEAVREGHVHVLRWFQSTSESARRAVRLASMANAVYSGNLEVVQFLREECGVAFGRLATAALVHVPSIALHDYVLDRGEVEDPEAFLSECITTRRVTLELLQHLVVHRGFWSREAFAQSVHRGSLAMCQFFYTRAQARAKDLLTTLDNVLNITSIAIGHVWIADLADWLFTLPEAFPVWTPSSTPSMETGFLSSPARNRILLAWLRHRPDECRLMMWLPVAAMRVHSFEALELVVAIGHPHLRDVATFRAVLRYTRDSRFLLKLLPLPAHDESNDTHSLRMDVVAWATKFGMVSVLDRVVDDEKARVQQELLTHIAQHVGHAGHTELVDWLLDRSVTFNMGTITMVQSGHGEPRPWRWSGVQTIAKAAVRHDHTAMLQSLEKRELLENVEPKAIESLVAAASSARQVRSLEWLIDNLPVPTKLLARVLMHAVHHNHMEMITFLTRRYEPKELPLNGHERIRVFKCLHTLTSIIAGAAVVECRQEGTADRRSKRSRRK